MFVYYEDYCLEDYHYVIQSWIHLSKRKTKQFQISVATMHTRLKSKTVILQKGSYTLFGHFSCSYTYLFKINRTLRFAYKIKILAVTCPLEDIIFVQFLGCPVNFVKTSSILRTQCWFFKKTNFYVGNTYKVSLLFCFIIGRIHNTLRLSSIRKKITFNENALLRDRR